MTKILKINGCSVCPYYEWPAEWVFGSQPICYKLKKVIPARYNIRLGKPEIIKNIPDWCPLEDK